jgi:hypothetical protein
MTNVRTAILAAALLFAPVWATPGLADQAGDDAYLALVAAAKHTPGKVDYTALRSAYAASSFYKKRDSDPDALFREGESAPPEQALQFSDANFPIVESQVVAMSFVPRGGDEFNMHLRTAQSLVKALLASGDGRSPATAYHVLATSEEFGVVAQEAKMTTIKSQAVSTVGGHAYDLFQGTDTQGREVAVWFDISAFFWVSAETTGDGLYLSMVAQAKKAPESIDYAKLRQLYAASRYYKKDASDANNLVAGTLLGGAKPSVEETKTFIDDNFVILTAQLLALDPTISAVGTPEHDMHLRVARQLVQAILAGGDGKSAPTAMHVLTVGEEYPMMSYLHVKLNVQALREDNGKAYDVMSCTDASGKPVDLWFDISAFVP